MAAHAQGTGTRAFALRLRELREASGRSYGALARRVGVSASTLHRYCSGHTVPMEFAPVERFARLCGCQGDDLVALHRLWMLADAERTLRQEAAGTLPRGGGARPPTTEAPGPAGPSGLPAPGTAVRPPGGAAGRSAPAVEASAGPSGLRAPVAGAPAADGGSSTADAGSSGASAPAAGPPAAGAADAPGVSVPPDGSGRESGETAIVLGEAPRTAAAPYRRPTVVAASAAVGAVGVLLAVLLAFDGFPSGGLRAAAGRPGATATVLPDGGETTPSGAPTASRPAGPAPSATVPAGRPGAPPPSGGTVPGDGTGPSGPNTGGAAPFTLSVDQHAWQAGCDHTYLVDRAPGSVPPPPAEADARPWADSLGAVHGGETLVRFTVQGRSERAVVLQALRVRVVAWRAPLSHNAFRMDRGCGGSLTERTFAVDLDRPRPVARPVAGADMEREIPAASFPYRVSSDDPEVLLATARTEDCDCDWYLELEWSSGDRSGTTRIDDGGRPFRTSGSRGGAGFVYGTGERRWISLDEREGSAVEPGTERRGGGAPAG